MTSAVRGDMRVAVWGWDGELAHQGGELSEGETVKQRLEGGLKVGDLVEVKKILEGEEWALASRPGQDKVQFLTLTVLSTSRVPFQHICNEL